MSSAKFNQSDRAKFRFRWQGKYGAFSFDKKRLPHIIEYVERQKEHHAENTTIPVLERVTDPDEDES